MIYACRVIRLMWSFLVAKRRWALSGRGNPENVSTVLVVCVMLDQFYIVR